MMRSRPSSGFTMIEMIIVMVITGIIAGMVAVFIRMPVEGYLSSVRRAELTEEADSALRLVVRDLQAALPNSIACTTATGRIEFLSIRSGGRYREAQTNASTGTPLVFGAAATSFDLLGNGADSSTKDARGNSVSGLSSRVVVGNLSSGVTNCHSDYANIATANNAATLSALGASSVTIVSDTYPTECQLSSPIIEDDSSTATVNEANDREFGKFYVVDSTPDTFVCDTTNGLTRNGVTVVAASHVSACQVACDDSKARVQLITLNLTLKDRDNEPVTMLRRAAIANRP